MAHAETPESEQVWRLHLAALRANGSVFGLDTDAERFGLSIGQWAVDQRIARQTNSLQQWQIDALDAVPGWVWEFGSGLPRGAQMLWQEKYDILCEYVNSHGWMPPRKLIYKNIGLGRWVAGQRTTYYTGRMDPERIKALEGVPGWSWRSNRKLHWRRKYQALQNYVNANGKLPVYDKLMSNSRRNLLIWMCNQKIAQRAGRLGEDRAKLLESLPGWTWETTKITPDKE